MAFANLKGVTYFPSVPSALVGVPTFGNVGSLDANEEKAFMAVQAPKTGNIRKVLWRTNGVVGTNTMDVRIETSDRTATPAIPSGTLWGTNTNGSQVLLTTDDNKIFVTQLTADAAVVQGDRLMVVIRMATVGTSVIVAGFTDGGAPHYPYVGTNTSGAYAAVTTVGPIVGFEYDDGTYEPVLGAHVDEAAAANTWNSGSTPDTYAQRFQLPIPARAIGFWFWGDCDDDVTVRLVTTAYHQANATGILTSLAVNNEDREADGVGYHEWLFPATVDLDANTNYRLVFEPGATGITVYEQSFVSLASMDAEDGGQLMHLSTAKDPTADGSWTNYNSGTFRRLYCGLLLRGFSDGAGGGVVVPQHIHGLESVHAL